MKKLVHSVVVVVSWFNGLMEQWIPVYFIHIYFFFF